MQVRIINTTLIQRQLQQYIHRIFMLICMIGSTSLWANNDSLDWHPAASEQLIQMPAKYINASIERHFQQSDLANGIHTLEAQIQLESTRMQETLQQLNQPTSQHEDSTALRHQFINAKSNYLLLVHEKHQLSERALTKKAQLYQRLLNRLQREKASRSNPMSTALIAKQHAARDRLNNSAKHVEQLLSTSLPGPSSQYQTDYKTNLAKVKELKQAIAKHSANSHPVLQGQSLDREQYIRYLLNVTDSELALLDQERLMLSYMAKLVALDAQALEQSLANDTENKTSMALQAQSQLINTSDMFMQTGAHHDN